MALVSLLWGPSRGAQSPLLGLSLHAQYALEVISLSEVGTAFQLKLLSGCSRVSKGVFRLTERHGPLAAPRRRARCVLLGHSVG